MILRPLVARLIYWMLQIYPPMKVLIRHASRQNMVPTPIVTLMASPKKCPRVVIVAVEQPIIKILWAWKPRACLPQKLKSEVIQCPLKMLMPPNL